MGTKTTCLSYCLHVSNVKHHIVNIVRIYRANFYLCCLFCIIQQSAHKLILMGLDIKHFVSFPCALKGFFGDFSDKKGNLSQRYDIISIPFRSYQIKQFVTLGMYLFSKHSLIFKIHGSWDIYNYILKYRFDISLLNLVILGT